MSKEAQRLKTLYVDEEHHRIARGVAAALGVSLQEAVKRLVRGAPDAAAAARLIASAVANK